MSMTISTEIKGATDLELFMEALDNLGIKAESSRFYEEVLGRQVLATAKVEGQMLFVTKNKDNHLTLVGDSDFLPLTDQKFKDRLMQQYGVASVKKKAKELKYTVTSTETLEDGSIIVHTRAWG